MRIIRITAGLGMSRKVRVTSEIIYLLLLISSEMNVRIDEYI